MESTAPAYTLQQISLLRNIIINDLNPNTCTVSPGPEQFEQVVGTPYKVDMSKLRCDKNIALFTADLQCQREQSLHALRLYGWTELPEGMDKDTDISNIELNFVTCEHRHTAPSIDVLNGRYTYQAVVHCEGHIDPEFMKSEVPLGLLSVLNGGDLEWFGDLGLRDCVFDYNNPLADAVAACLLRQIGTPGMMFTDLDVYGKPAPYPTAVLNKGFSTFPYRKLLLHEFMDKAKGDVAKILKPQLGWHGESTEGSEENLPSKTLAVLWYIFKESKVSPIDLSIIANPAGGMPMLAPAPAHYLRYKENADKETRSQLTALEESLVVFAGPLITGPDDVVDLQYHSIFGLKATKVNGDGKCINTVMPWHIPYLNPFIVTDEERKSINGIILKMAYETNHAPIEGCEYMLEGEDNNE